uniref:Uncharacterized protein n=1 Tax=Chromera velia CCMP2878 TaxID=1169474 RepID=A0A0G4IFP1_9ALVE|eukprot:Cvel_14027.t1-p1 / transcript=Cvel_14027.t1 / gene=Cvel_14027 / organism=Chromera_velia_CCMP2878 / gene_product=hypothetical protein / transcript_product=hypothetical protein / location=Cvel_scaffold982:31508-42964(-) / protein_length=258 / sequence_SO=supercontig / SO=protein_coding / is_pseudo=false
MSDAFLFAGASRAAAPLPNPLRGKFGRTSAAAAPPGTSFTFLPVPVTAVASSTPAQRGGGLHGRHGSESCTPQQQWAASLRGGIFFEGWMDGSFFMSVDHMLEDNGIEFGLGGQRLLLHMVEGGRKGALENIKLVFDKAGVPLFTLFDHDAVVTGENRVDSKITVLGALGSTARIRKTTGDSVETSSKGDEGRAEADTREITESLELYSRPPKHGHLWTSHSGEGDAETVVPEEEEEVEGSWQVAEFERSTEVPRRMK